MELVMIERIRKGIESIEDERYSSRRPLTSSYVHPEEVYGEICECQLKLMPENEGKTSSPTFGQSMA
jgi:hypothetical protein